MKSNPWIEAIRLRTLPVSVAGVVAGGACSIYSATFLWLPFLICMVFALLAQIVSNFANEYFDFKNGLDRKGRAGFRRGVTEGDISPKAMLTVTVILLILDSLLGLTLLFWAPLWIIFIGIAIALFALAYSAGPYPLSRHALGEVAVIIFFGIVPVNLTAFICSAGNAPFLTLSLPVSVAIGLMGANVLIINNYRDVPDDTAVKKITLAVLWGPDKIRTLYIVNAVIATLLLVWFTIGRASILWQAGTLAYANLSCLIWIRMKHLDGAALNPLLGQTAMLMCATSVWLLLLCIFN